MSTSTLSRRELMGVAAASVSFTDANRCTSTYPMPLP